MYIRIPKLTPKYLVFARPAVWWFKPRHSTSPFLKTTVMAVHVKSVTAEKLIKGRCEKKTQQNTEKRCNFQLSSSSFVSLSNDCVLAQSKYWLKGFPPFRLRTGARIDWLAVMVRRGSECVSALIIPPKIRGVSFSPDKHFKCTAENFGTRCWNVLKMF